MTLCTRCGLRFAERVVVAGESGPLGAVCLSCLDDVMYVLSFTEPEGRDGYASFRAAEGLSEPVHWPDREPLGVAEDVKETE